MPRSLSTALQTQVSSTATKTAFLVELNLSSTIRLTDWYSNVTYDSNSYEAGGSFLGVDTSTETGQGRHYSQESQEAFSTGDKGFEFATQVKSDVRWGS